MNKPTNSAKTAQAEQVFEQFAGGLHNVLARRLPVKMPTRNTAKRSAKPQAKKRKASR